MWLFIYDDSPVKQHQAIRLHEITLLRVIPTMTFILLLLANLLAFYLTYLRAFYLGYLLAFYLAYLLAFYRAYLLQYVLAYLLAFYLAFYLAYLLAFYLTFLLAFDLTFYLANLLAFYLANILALYLAYLLAFYLTFYLAFYLAYLLAFYLAVEVQRCPLSSEGPRLRSSGAHWARKAPGWGPAVPTELWRSQVEVQWCPLSSEGPRLRSSGAHWALKVPGWGPAVPTALRPLRLRSAVPTQIEAGSWGPAVPTARGSWRRAWRRVGKADSGKRRRRRRRRTTLIKSNNPHLAGGELPEANVLRHPSSWPEMLSSSWAGSKLGEQPWAQEDLHLELSWRWQRPESVWRSTQGAFLGYFFYRIEEFHQEEARPGTPLWGTADPWVRGSSALIFWLEFTALALATLEPRLNILGCTTHGWTADFGLALSLPAWDTKKLVT